jgi:hypothetical protein
MLDCCQAPTYHHKAIYEKYCEKRFKEAAFVVQQEIDDGFTLPRSGNLRQSTRSQQPSQPESCVETFHSSNQVLISTEG